MSCQHLSWKLISATLPPHLTASLLAPWHRENRRRWKKKGKGAPRPLSSALEWLTVGTVSELHLKLRQRLWHAWRDSTLMFVLREGRCGWAGKRGLGAGKYLLNANYFWRLIKWKRKWNDWLLTVAGSGCWILEIRGMLKIAPFARMIGSFKAKKLY